MVQNTTNIRAEFQDNNPVDWLRVWYANRKRSNPSYSLRAFAKALSIPSGRLSEIFDGKRQLTVALGEEISSRLAMSPEESTTFLELIENRRKDARKKKSSSNSESIVRKGATIEYSQLATDTFYVIADWLHYAILNLVETDDFNSNVTWIAERLGVSTVEVRTAIDRLSRLGLLRHNNGSLQRTKGGLTTTHDVPSSALRRSHKQTLEQAIVALEEVPLEFRDVTSVTMPISLSRLPEAKRMIRDFRRGLAAFLESDGKEEVYNLNIQLIPVTKIRK